MEHSKLVFGLSNEFFLAWIPEVFFLCNLFPGVVNRKCCSNIHLKEVNLFCPRALCDLKSREVAPPEQQAVELHETLRAFAPRRDHLRDFKVTIWI